MTIFYYLKKSDKSLIGYHTSTMCTTSLEESKAKKYNCKDEEAIERQKEVISKNFKSVMETTVESKGFFDPLLFMSKELYFKDLTFEDVELLHKQLN